MEEWGEKKRKARETERGGNKEDQHKELNKNSCMPNCKINSSTSHCAGET